jgi:hypothetical protein
VVVVFDVFAAVPLDFPPQLARVPSARTAITTTLSDLLIATSSSAETIEGTTVAFGRSSRSAIAGCDGKVALARRRRAVIDEALGRDRCSDALVDDTHDLELTVVTVRACRDPITDSDVARRLRRCTVDPDVAAAYGVGGRGPRRVHAHRPQPSVDPRPFHRSSVAGSSIKSLVARPGSSTTLHR